jgi:predicted transglutaminase-like cysteine proteinase
MRFHTILLGPMLCLSTTISLAGDFANPAYAPVTKETSIPIGAYEFCRQQPLECGPNAERIAAMVLTDDRWAQLISVNSEMNTAIAPLSDEDQYQVAEYWTYPTVAGDCEDYALAKRRALIQAGWAASTLLISTVMQKSGEGHAVLMVRTDRGDLILDNQDGDIHLWNETPYTYLKRQSQQDSGRWVAIGDDRPVVVASAH